MSLNLHLLKLLKICVFDLINLIDKNTDPPGNEDKQEKQEAKDEPKPSNPEPTSSRLLTTTEGIPEVKPSEGEVAPVFEPLKPRGGFGGFSRGRPRMGS